jgi:ElaB/YqjD/DUF883 family membrane-anchored ribosome-binding protein
MPNEAVDIAEEIPQETPAWKAKAKVAGTAAWDATKSAYEAAQEKTVACTKATDEAIRENPYIAMGVAFGLGALLGFFLTRGGSEED